jgi:hypothetical protein
MKRHGAIADCEGHADDISFRRRADGPRGAICLSMQRWPVIAAVTFLSAEFVPPMARTRPLPVAEVDVNRPTGRRTHKRQTRAAHLTL